MSLPRPKVIVRKLGREGAWGQCYYDPVAPTVEIDPRLGAKRRLEVLVHEAVHLFFGPDLPEAKVDAAGKYIRDVLWAQNYRQVLLEPNAKPPRIS
jgi:hypothetical protein